MKIHLDTDLGGDIDDLCALALLLGLPDVEITGITTVSDEGGRRCGYVRCVLQLAGRSDIPVFAGADISLGCFRFHAGYPREADCWPEPVAPSPNPLQSALDLLARSVEQGAAVVAIGPYTNLALLDRAWPGVLNAAPIYLMGFHVRLAPPGFRQWGIEDDWNVQMDVSSAKHLLERHSPTLIPLEMSGQTALRRSYLPGLRRPGLIGALIALQAEAFAREEGYEAKYGRTCPGLPSDTINFLHDPLACAVATGWDGARTESVPLRIDLDASGYLRAAEAPDGKPTNVVTCLDGRSFSDWWYTTITGSTDVPR